MTIPDELRRSAPRDVSLTRAGWKAILLPGAMAVCLAMGIQARHFDHYKGAFFVLGWATPFWNSPLELGIVLVGAAIGWWRYRRQSSLLIHGRATVVSVTDFERRLRLVAHWRGNRLHCEFRLLNGSVCRTTVDIPPRDEVPDRDEEIVIVYDPDEPKKAMLYPTQMLTVRAR